MRQMINPLVLAAGMVAMLAIPSSAQDAGKTSVSQDEPASLLGSPPSWVMGPTTGLPNLFGWRVERFWREEGDRLPAWTADLDLGVVMPGIRVGAERRLLDSPFYAGLGGRLVYVPLFGFQDNARFYSLSIPFSYRSGTGWDRRALHVSVSLEAVTHDFNDWGFLPALQISILSRL